MLELKNLVAGDYEFRLIVTDSDSVRNSTTATLTVNKSEFMIHIVTIFLYTCNSCFCDKIHNYAIK